MDDHHDDRRASGGGLSRRDVVRRGALLAGASVWATPAVQTLTRPAFASLGTPPEMAAISWAAVLYDIPEAEATQAGADVLELQDETVTPQADLGSDVLTFRAKFDDGGLEEGGRVPPGGFEHCGGLDGWDQALSTGGFDNVAAPQGEFADFFDGEPYSVVFYLDGKAQNVRAAGGGGGPSPVGWCDPAVSVGTQNGQVVVVVSNPNFTP